MGKRTGLLVSLLALATMAVLSAQSKVRRFGDSTTFDPDGYYIPATDIVVRGDTIKNFEVRTLSYYYDGSLHYKRPELVTPPHANVAIGYTTGEAVRHDCDIVTVGPEGLSLSCDTPVGQLTLEATYLDKRGRYWNIIDYELEPRVVATGHFHIVASGFDAELLPVDLIYTGGH